MHKYIPIMIDVREEAFDKWYTRIAKKYKLSEDSHLRSWLFMSFKSGWIKGQTDFMKNHDWYE